MKKFTGFVIVAVFSATAFGQLSLINTDLDDTAADGYGTEGLTSSITLTNGDVLVENVGGTPLGWRDNMDTDATDDEWLGSNAGHIVGAIDGVTGGALATASVNGARYIGGYVGASGDTLEVRLNHTITAAEASALNTNPFVAVADVAAAFNRIASNGTNPRGRAFAIRAKVNGSTQATSNKVWYVNSTGATALGAISDTVVDVEALLGVSGATAAGIVGQNTLNSGIFAPGTLAAGDVVSVELKGLNNQSGGISGSNQKNAQAMMTNIKFVQLAAGDTDGDLDFDGTDVVNLNAGAKFLNGAAVWGEGDFTGDSLFNGNDVVAMNATALFNTGSYAAVQAGPGAAGDGLTTLIYDPTTGNITLETEGATLNGFQLVSASGIFTGDAANLQGLLTIDSDVEINGGFGGAYADGYDLGNVAALGLDLATLEADLAASVVTISGTPGVFDVNIAVVPEPMTMSLLAIGGLVAIRRRRR